MRRAVLDPNVLVSAVLTPQGVSAQALRACRGRCTIITCPRLVDELTTVLRNPKFRRYLSEAEGASFVQAISDVGEFHPDPVEVPAVSRDPADDYLFGLARVAGADVIVSGDPDLTSLSGTYPPVLTPRAFLEQVSVQAEENRPDIQGG